MLGGLAGADLEHALADDRPDIGRHNQQPHYPAATVQDQVPIASHKPPMAH
jgi:hypothetical protein